MLVCRVTNETHSYTNEHRYINGMYKMLYGMAPRYYIKDCTDIPLKHLMECI